MNNPKPSPEIYNISIPVEVIRDHQGVQCCRVGIPYVDDVSRSCRFLYERISGSGYLSCMIDGRCVDVSDLRSIKPFLDQKCVVREYLLFLNNKMKQGDNKSLEEITRYTDIEQRIITAINFSHWHARTIDGIATELNETSERIAHVVRNLMESKDVIELTDKCELYYTTPEKYKKTHSLLNRLIAAITGIWRL